MWAANMIMTMYGYDGTTSASPAESESGTETGTETVSEDTQY